MTDELLKKIYEAKTRFYGSIAGKIQTNDSLSLKKR